MALIVNKIANMEKAIANLQQELQGYKEYAEQRFKKIDRTLTTLTTKMDELGNTFDACFADGEEVETNETSKAIEESLSGDNLAVTFDGEGNVLVPGNLKEEYLNKGYYIVGTVSKDTEILLKMRLL